MWRWQERLEGCHVFLGVLDNGVSAYMYWNISLENGGISRWGWAQNSLVVVDPQTKSYRYTPEYYVMKHVSHYVQPGAYKLETEGAYTNLLAFRNPDNSIALIIANETSDDRSLSIRIGDRVYTPIVKAYSMNTLLVD